jgi:hypothetical protein
MRSQSSHLHQLNIPMPCPPRGTVPVNTGAWFARLLHLSTPGSLSVRDATAPAMRRGQDHGGAEMTNNHSSWPLRPSWFKPSSCNLIRAAVSFLQRGSPPPPPWRGRRSGSCLRIHGHWSADKAESRDYERQLIERFRKMYGDDALPGNKSNH